MLDSLSFLTAERANMTLSATPELIQHPRQMHDGRHWLWCYPESALCDPAPYQKNEVPHSEQPSPCFCALMVRSKLEPSLGHAK